MPRLAGGVSAVILIGLVVGLVMMRPSGSAEPPRKDQFAEDQAPPPAEPVDFDADKAMKDLEALCKIGPRMSGTRGMKRQQELLEKHFKECGGKVTWQRFTGRQKNRNPVEMANLIVSWHPERTRRVILCSHYDTRPHADEERDPRRRGEPFLSANDGGSGVALLMELARHMNKLETRVGVDFVFFDGEEYVWDRDDTYFFGSRHFGQQYKKKRMGKTEYLAAVLLDMVGGKDARFPVEPNSWRWAEPLVRSVWGTAAELKCEAFIQNEFTYTDVLDDHIPLNQNGIPAIDIIDFKYPHWHRVSDVPENCSGESMKMVGRVLSVWLQRLK